MDSLLRERHINYLLCGAERIRSSPSGRSKPGTEKPETRHRRCVDEDLESHDGKSSAVRLGCQFEMVHEDEHYSLPEQSRPVQGETWPVTLGKLFPRLFRWK